MLWASPHELLIIALVFLIVTGGPLLAGWILAWVRRRRARRAASRPPPPS